MTIFKSSDIRGRVPGDIDGEFAYRLGYSLRRILEVPASQDIAIAVGRDARDSSPGLATALLRGIADSGLTAVDIGVCITEMLYFSVFSRNFAGGVMVTASHNPHGYNGFKVVGPGAVPKILHSGDIAGASQISPRSGGRETLDVLPEYLRLVYSFLDSGTTGPLPAIACDPGVGSAAGVLRAMQNLHLTMIPPMDEGGHDDAAYNPLLPRRRAHTSGAVAKAHAGFGVAFDGDGDRCIFFDENGEYIEPYYMVGLLADYFLARYPGGGIIHDTRLEWNTRHIVESRNGVAIPCKGGHAHFKLMMAKTGAVFGGEASGHYFFRDFGNCDSGIIPMVLTASILRRSGQSLSSLVRGARRRFVCADEISLPVPDPDGVLRHVEQALAPMASGIERLDGLSMEFGRWRMCLRKSGTESVLRLNVESRSGQEGLHEALNIIMPLLPSAEPT